MTEHAMNPDEPLKENTRGMLRLFVYETLKRGFWDHDRFSRGVLDIREAVVRSRLHEMHSGIPGLQVTGIAHERTTLLFDWGWWGWRIRS